MKKIIIALAATAALAAAMPAAAQSGGGGNFQARIGELQTQLQAEVRSGAISRHEAVPLREQLRQLTALERQYRRGGFTAQERNVLQNRIQNLRQGIRTAARSGGDRWGRDDRHRGRDCPPGLERKNNGCTPPGQVGRDGRWGNDDRDDRDDRYGRDRDDDRYGRDRDDDRYGRDRDDRYEDRHRRGVIGDVIGGGLRVGQRASANLGAVPNAYRNQYRDGNGVYYRADARSIYQIDARSHIVLRIYAMNR